jgi:Domain of unknown function (DUF3850)
MRHKLKSWLGAFSDVVAQVKRCEVRRCDDRVFQLGDELELQEYDNEKEQYTGKATLVRVIHIIRRAGPTIICGVSAQQIDVIPMAVMSIVPIPWKDEKRP